MEEQFLGFLAALIFIWLAAIYIGIELRSINDVTNIITEILERQEAERTLGVQLTERNKISKAAEEISFENLREQFKIVKSLSPGKSDSSPEFIRFVNKSNENHDMLRSPIILGGIYSKLVSSNSHDENTNKLLINLYNAVLEIALDDPNDEKNSFNNKETRQKAKDESMGMCDPDFEKGTFNNDHICKAKMLLENVERNIDEFPVEVQYEVQIEVLRYLSYCAARSLETKNQSIYTKRAEKIMQAVKSKNKDIFEGTYRSKYYWIDYSFLILSVMKQEPDFEKEADKYFSNLRGGLATQIDFLRYKLIQHESLMINSDQKEIWQGFIKKARQN